MTASTRKPLLVVADDDPADRARVLDELSRRYSGDYAIGGCAIAELEARLDQAEAVAHSCSRVSALASRPPGAGC